MSDGRELIPDKIPAASALIFLALIPLVFLTRHSKGGAGSADAAAGAH